MLNIYLATNSAHKISFCNLKSLYKQEGDGCLRTTLINHLKDIKFM